MHRRIQKSGVQAYARYCQVTKKTGRRIRIKNIIKTPGEEIVQIFSRVLLSQGRDMYYLLEFRDGYITIYRFPVSIKIIYGFQNMSLCQCS